MLFLVMRNLISIIAVFLNLWYLLSTQQLSLWILSWVLTDNLVENLLDFEYELKKPYLLYRNAAQEVNGIWFYNQDECEEVANLFNRYDNFLFFSIQVTLVCFFFFFFFFFFLLGFFSFFFFFFFSLVIYSYNLQDANFHQSGLNCEGLWCVYVYFSG